MKKYLFLMIALVGLVGMSGCDKNDDSYYNPNRTFIYTIGSSDWSLNSDGSISYDINLPELTSYYLTQGLVSVSLSGDGEKSYDILPSTFQGVAYSVNYTEGFVSIYGEDPLADSTYPIEAPKGDIVIKVVLSDSDYVQ